MAIRSKLLRLLIVGLTLSVVLLATLCLWIKREVSSGRIEREVVRLLKETCGIEATLGAIRLAPLGSVSIEVLNIKTPRSPTEAEVSVDRIVLDYSPSDLLRLRLKFKTLRFVHPRIILTLEPGTTPLRSAPRFPSLDTERVLLENVSIQDGDIHIEDRTTQPPMVVDIQSVDLGVELPRAARPLTFHLTSQPATGRAEIRGEYSPSTGSATSAFKVVLPDLSFALARLSGFTPEIIPLKLGLAVEGEVTVGPEGVWYKVKTMVDPFEGALTSPVSTTVRAKIGALVKPGSLRLDPMEVHLGDLEPFMIKADVTGWNRPGDLLDPIARKSLVLDANVSLGTMSLPKVISLLPRNLLPSHLDRLTGGMGSLNAQIRGRAGSLDVTATLKLHEVNASIGEFLDRPFGFGRATVSIDPSRLGLTVERLAAPGVEATIRAIVDDWKTHPRLRLDLENAKIEIAELLSSLRKGFPDLNPEACKGSLLLSSRLKLAPDKFLEELQRKGPVDWNEIRSRLETEMLSLRKGTALQIRTKWTELLDRLGASLDLSLLLRGGAVRWASVPGGVLEFDLVAESKANDLKISNLEIGIPGLKAGIQARWQDPLGRSQLDASITVPTSSGRSRPKVALSRIIALVPPGSLPNTAPVPFPESLVRVEVDLSGQLALWDAIDRLLTRVNAEGVGWVSAFSSLPLPEPTVRIEASGLKATVPVGSRLVPIETPAVRAELVRRGVTVSCPTLRAPFATLSVSASAGPLTCDASAPLDLDRIRATLKPDELPFSIKIDTNRSSGIDLALLAPFIPLDRLPIPKIHPMGKLSLSLAASGPLTAPSGNVSATLDAGGFHMDLTGQGTDLADSRNLNVKAAVRLERIAQTLKQIAPTVKAGIVADLPPAAKVVVGLGLEGKKGGYRGRVDVQGLEIQTWLSGTLDDLPRPAEMTLDGGYRLGSLERTVELLPANWRAKVEENGAQASVSGPIHAEFRGPRAQVRVGALFTRLKASPRGLAHAVTLDLPRTALKSELSLVSGGPAPFSGQIEIRAIGTIRVDGKEIPVEIGPSSLSFAPGLLSARQLRLKLQDQSGQVDLDLSKDATKERRIAAEARFPSLDLGRLVRTFGQLDPDIRVEGNIGVVAHARGPVSHPELIDAGASVLVHSSEVKHPWLKGLPATLSNGTLKITRDDVVLTDCDRFIVRFGARSFPIPCCGSIKALASVDNLFEADPAKVGPVILEKLGGPKKILALLGDEQLLRVTGDLLHKIRVNIRVVDRTEDFVYQSALTPEESKSFRENSQRYVDKYIRIAKQDLASQMGFPKSTHGEDNYKMLRIEKAKAVVLDHGFNMVYPKEIPFWRLTSTPSEW